MKDATVVTLAGYCMATTIVSIMLYTDGTTAALVAASVATAGTGLGQYLGKRAK